MVCLGFEPRAAAWKVQTNPLSCGSNPIYTFFIYNKICALIVFALWRERK